MRTLSMLLFAIYLLVSAISSGLVDLNGPPIELREDFFVPHTSSSAEYMRRFHSAFDRHDDYLELVFDTPMYSSASEYFYSRRHKEQITSLLKWAVDEEYTTTKPVSWLVDFDQFQKESIFEVNAETAVPVLKYVFLRTDPYELYASDLVFDRFHSQIIRSRMYIELSAKGRQASNRVVRELLGRAKAVGLPLSIKAPFAFSLHHDLQALSTAMKAFTALLVSITLLCFIFFPQPAICLTAAFSMPSVSIGVCGLSVYFSIPLNIVTLSTILLGALLTSLIALHFAYSFSNYAPALAERHRASRILRMQYSFQSSLIPTLLSLLAPILVYLPLLINDTPIILHIWLVLCINSLLSALYFLLVLPSVTTILSHYCTSLCLTANRLCGDENGNGCFMAEQPADSIYYVGATRSAANLNTALMLGDLQRYQMAMLTNGPQYLMGPNGMFPPSYYYGGQRRMLMAPPLPPLPIEYSSRRQRDQYEMGEGVGEEVEGEVEGVLSGGERAFQRQRHHPPRSPGGQGRRRIIVPAHGNGRSRSCHGGSDRLRGGGGDPPEEGSSNFDSLDSRRNNHAGRAHSSRPATHICPAAAKNQPLPSSCTSSRHHTTQRRHFVNSPNTKGGSGSNGSDFRQKSALPDGVGTNKVAPIPQRRQGKERIYEDVEGMSTKAAPAPNPPPPPPLMSPPSNNRWRQVVAPPNNGSGVKKPFEGKPQRPAAMILDDQQQQGFSNVVASYTKVSSPAQERRRF